MKLSHYYNLVICKTNIAAQPTQLVQQTQLAPPPYPSPKGRGVKCVISLVVRKVLCEKPLSIKKAFMSDTLSVRELLCVIPPLSQ